MNTNFKKTFACIWTALILITFFSCKDDDDSSGQPMPAKEVNQWIYNTMNMYYLWNDHLPANPSFNQKPDVFFYSICNTYDKYTNPDGDRFSFIYSDYQALTNELHGIASNEIGFEYSLGIYSGSYLFGQIEYVKKGTPAQKEGLKRGQVFTAINGNNLTIYNYQSLLLNLQGKYTITLHNVEMNPEDEGRYKLSAPFYKDLSTISSYKDNPILLDSIYTIDNKQVGYLVYNFFADDNNDNSLSFDIALKDVFQKFISHSVSELIIDLRYNSGGSLGAAQCMSSMLVKDRNTSNVFLEAQYNALLTEAFLEEQNQSGEDPFKIYFTDKIAPLSKPSVSLPNIGNQLNKLIFLTGRNTASASEVVINSLKPYGMNITLIGDTTIGKNVGSMTFYDEEHTSTNKWAIQPIIVKLNNANGQSDYTSGFYPDIINQDEDLIRTDLGDINESLLSNAFDFIKGVPRLRKSNVAQASLFRIIDSSINKKIWSNRTILPSNQLPIIK